MAIIYGIVLDMEANGQGRVIKMSINQLEPFSIQTPIVLNDFSEIEKPQKDKGEELQQYRRKKLEQFGKILVKPQELNIKKHQN